MSVRTRVRALERKQANCRGPVCPPVEFFDAIIAGRATRQEWNRWTPWLLATIFSPCEKEVSSSATETEWTPQIEDQRPSGKT
jgi:hypothetical protein